MPQNINEFSLSSDWLMGNAVIRDRITGTHLPGLIGLILQYTTLGIMQDTN